MNSNPFLPSTLISRETEFQQICELLLQDKDFVLVGIPGMGRRTILREATHTIKARRLEIDCLRSTNAKQFLRLIANSITDCFSRPEEIQLLQQWVLPHPITIESSPSQGVQMIWHLPTGQEWQLFVALLTLPQFLSEKLDCRVVMMFQNFPHIRSWDRQGKWETYLRQVVQEHTRVSYVLVATVVEPWVNQSNLAVIHLFPLENAVIKAWLDKTMTQQGLQFNSNDQAIELFLSYVQGHFGDAITLARRLGLDHKANDYEYSTICAHHVYRSLLALVEDMSVTFETLLTLLPSNQVRILESLALDPTDRPQSRHYIKKHQLSRGGGLQGALNSLEQKGLIYGANYSYRIALPFFAFWLKLRLL